MSDNNNDGSEEVTGFGFNTDIPLSGITLSDYKSEMEGRFEKDEKKGVGRGQTFLTEEAKAFRLNQIDKVLECLDTWSFDGLDTRDGEFDEKYNSNISFKDKALYLKALEFTTLLCRSYDNVESLDKVDFRAIKDSAEGNPSAEDIHPFHPQKIIMVLVEIGGQESLRKSWRDAIADTILDVLGDYAGVDKKGNPPVNWQDRLSESLAATQAALDDSDGKTSEEIEGLERGFAYLKTLQEVRSATAVPNQATLTQLKYPYEGRPAAIGGDWVGRLLKSIYRKYLSRLPKKAFYTEDGEVYSPSEDDFAESFGKLLALWDGALLHTSWVRPLFKLSMVEWEEGLERKKIEEQKASNSFTFRVEYVLAFGALALALGAGFYFLSKRGK